MLENVTEREKIIQQEEKLWVLCLDDANVPQIKSKLIETIDWYQNSQLTKALVKKKISLSFGERTLFASFEILKATKILVFGLGNGADLNEAQAHRLLKNLSAVLTDLKEVHPWLAIGSDGSGTNSEFSSHVDKLKTSFPLLSDSVVSLG